MIAPEDLTQTIKLLDKIINSAVHPDIAVRVLLVELEPIRKERARLIKLLEKP